MTTSVVYLQCRRGTLPLAFPSLKTTASALVVVRRIREALRGGCNEDAEVRASEQGGGS